ncbi:MAG: metallophosphoesterase [Bacteroidales bacterium]|nr:metallophosphoesterase [Bacteroidales bacterium]
MLTCLFVIASLISMNMSEAGLKEKIPQNQGPLFSFGVIADVQYCNCEPAGIRFYRASKGRLREALEAFRADSVNFVLNLGDLIDRDFESFRPLLGILDSSNLEIYHVTGNHDYSVEKRLKKNIPLPMPSPEGYYSFSFQSYRFIALNGNDLSTYASANNVMIKKAGKYLNELKESGSINAVDWNGAIGGKQMKWFKDELDRSKDAGEKVFIFCHFPVYPENVHNLLN